MVCLLRKPDARGTRVRRNLNVITFASRLFCWTHSRTLEILIKTKPFLVSLDCSRPSAWDEREDTSFQLMKLLLTFLRANEYQFIRWHRLFTEKNVLLCLLEPMYRLCAKIIPTMSDKFWGGDMAVGIHNNLIRTAERYEDEDRWFSAVGRTIGNRREVIRWWKIRLHQDQLVCIKHPGFRNLTYWLISRHESGFRTKIVKFVDRELRYGHDQRGEFSGSIQDKRRIQKWRTGSMSRRNPWMKCSWLFCE